MMRRGRPAELSVHCSFCKDNNPAMDLRWMHGRLIVFWLVFRMAAGNCDPNFKINVELCIQHVKDFLTFVPETVTIFSDVDAAEVVCRQGLVNGSTACLEQQYARCPRVAVFRRQCGYQTLEPDIMRKHNDVVCNKLQVLQRDMSCLLERQCAMKSCMANFDQLTPSRLSAGMWKTPKHSGSCRLYSYTWHCLEKSVISECHKDSVAVLQDLMWLYRPPSCTEDEVEVIKDSFNSISAIANNCAASPIYISGLSAILCFLLWRPAFLSLAWEVNEEKENLVRGGEREENNGCMDGPMSRKVEVNR